jgi:hypothetical protein
LGVFFRIDQGVGAARLGAAADPQAQGEGGGQVVAGEPVPVREIPESAAGQGLDDRRAEVSEQAAGVGDHQVAAGAQDPDELG